MQSGNRTLSTIFALVIGLLVLLQGHHAPFLHSFDLTCAGLPFANQNVIIEHDSASNTLSKHQLIKSDQIDSRFQMIRIGSDPDQIFEQTPPSALDYAVILESLHNHGYREVNITTKLNWDHPPGILTSVIDTRAALFDSAIIPLSLSRSPTGGTMPPMLKRSIIPNTQISGDTSLIPTANRLTFSSPIQGSSPNTYASFYEIENIPPAAGKILMLANWSDHGIIPSTQLLTLMQAYRTTPSDLLIHSGKHIRLGKHGPVISIDEYGQASLPTIAHTDNFFKNATEAQNLITQKKSAKIHDQIALLYAEGPEVESTNTLTHDELNNTLALINTFHIPCKGKPYPHIPRWALIILIIDLVILVYFTRGMTRPDQHLIFLLITSLLFMFSFALMETAEQWLRLSTPAAILIAGWIVPIAKRRATTQMPHYNTTDPRPIIRA